MPIHVEESKCEQDWRQEVSLGVAILFFGLALFAPSGIEAQVIGNKATYNSSSVPSSSQVWIDASAFCGTSNADCASGSDICSAVLNAALAKVPSTGETVDARGVVPASSTSGSYTCTTNPFASLMDYPTTLLLPAYAIVTSATWELPNNTRIIGEGQGTQLVAASGMSGDLIEMGTSTLCPSGCTSIGIEHLLLNGANTTSLTAGINNLGAQGGSYVNDVNFYSFSNTGLIVSTGGANSGPYSNITFGTNSTGSAVPKCVDLEAQTLGVHGITCTGNTSATYTQGESAIWINASNNSIEDAHLELYWDGIEVGNISGGTVSNVVISNVTGSHGMINDVTDLCTRWNVSVTPLLQFVRSRRRGCGDVGNGFCFPHLHTPVLSAESLAARAVGSLARNAAAWCCIRSAIAL